MSHVLLSIRSKILATLQTRLPGRITNHNDIVDIVIGVITSNGYTYTPTGNKQAYDIRTCSKVEKNNVRVVFNARDSAIVDKHIGVFEIKTVTNWQTFKCNDTRLSRSIGGVPTTYIFVNLDQNKQMRLCSVVGGEYMSPKTHEENDDIFTKIRTNTDNECNTMLNDGGYPKMKFYIRKNGDLSSKELKQLVSYDKLNKFYLLG